jgi:hypothetical protein
MRVRSKHVLGLLFALLLVGVAFSPLLGAGFVAADWQALAAPPAGAAHLAVEAPGGPLARALDGATGALGRSLLAGGARAAPLLRALNLLVYLAGAPFLFAYARRLLRPWCGDEQARAAALAACLVFAVHPLAPVSVASVAALPEILGTSCALICLAAFLVGRQERSLRATGTSLALAFLDGSATQDALLLPLALAASEFLAANRQRSLRERLRTSATALVVFGAAVALDLVLAALDRAALVLPTLSGGGRGLAWLSGTAERLGLIVLPANPLALGASGIALAGGVFLLVLQPALVGARSAPRLWGWMLLWWFGALIVSVVARQDVRVVPERFELARGLLASVVPLAIGIGLASTALAGMRRWYVTWSAVVGYAIVAHGNARPWIEAARTCDALRGVLAATAARHPAAELFVLDAPGPVRGVEAVGRDFAPLFASDGGVPSVRASSTRAFLELLREPEGRERIDAHAVLLRTLTPGPGYDVVELQRGPPSGAQRSWRASLASPPLDWNPLEIGALRVTTQADADLSALRSIGWKARRATAGQADAWSGAWSRAGAQATGLFDLGSSLDWRLAGRVRSVFLPEGRQSIDAAEALEDLPTLGELLPLEEGGDWIFRGPEPDAPVARDGPAHYVLGLLDVERLEWREFPVRSEARGLVARGAAAYARERIGRVAWRLELRAGDLALARTRGRA